MKYTCFQRICKINFFENKASYKKILFFQLIFLYRITLIVFPIVLLVIILYTIKVLKKVYLIKL